MSLLDELLNSQNANVLKQLAGTFGVAEGDARTAVGSLLPALSRGISHEISNPSRVNDLMGAWRRGNHQQYLDRPEALGREETIQDGTRSWAISWAARMSAGVSSVTLPIKPAWTPVF